MITGQEKEKSDVGYDCIASQCVGKCAKKCRPARAWCIECVSGHIQYRRLGEGTGSDTGGDLLIFHMKFLCFKNKNSLSRLACGHVVGQGEALVVGVVYNVATALGAHKNILLCCVHTHGEGENFLTRMAVCVLVCYLEHFQNCLRMCLISTSRAACTGQEFSLSGQDCPFTVILSIPWDSCKLEQVSGGFYAVFDEDMKVWKIPSFQNIIHFHGSNRLWKYSS